MKLINHKYSNLESLQSFIKTNNINDENLLIQVFTANNKKDYISLLIENIISLLPKAKIIGSTTSGEISSKGLSESSTVLSFSQFQNTKIYTMSKELQNSSFKMGIELFKSFPLQTIQKSKVAICFTDGLHTNGEEFLKGISSINDTIVVAGGMAGDYSTFTDTFVFTQDTITNNGAVMALLENESLNVFTEYSFNWDTMGKNHHVTKSEKNRIYTIDDRTAVDFYKYYLGDKIEALLPAIGIEFPIVIQKGNMNIGRAVIEKHDDGSLSFAGNVQEGCQIKFGHGNINMILNKSYQSVLQLQNLPVEGIFIYSCMARKALLGKNINMEIKPFNQIAPMSGFFTNGEFFHDSKNQKTNKLLNESMTILAISESNTIPKNTIEKYHKKSSKEDEIHINRLEAISHLISQTTNELDELTLNLEQRVELEVKKNIEKDNLLNIAKTQAELGSMLEMIIHQWRQPLSGISAAASGIQIQNEYDMLTKKGVEEATQVIMDMVAHANDTITDFRELFSNIQNYEHIRADKLLAKVKNIFKFLLDKNNIKLEENYNCPHDRTLYVPVGQMVQVLLVIFKNSIDALLENKIKDPKIIVDIGAKEDKCLITIEDNGGGIPEELLDKIFDYKFSTKEKKHGTGVGLDMGKKIITQKLNGTIDVENKNDGAVFYIAIPSELISPIS